jgi:hypothetical protein
MRLFRPVDLILLIVSALILLLPTFFDSKFRLAELLLLNCISIAAGAAAGLVGSIINFVMGNVVSKEDLRWRGIFLGLLYNGYWTITGACVGGSIGWLGWIGVLVSVAGTVLLLLIPLAIMVFILPIVTPIVAAWVVLMLIARLDRKAGWLRLKPLLLQNSPDEQSCPPGM